MSGLRRGLAWVVLLGLAACAGHLDLTPEGNSARVLVGEIRFGDGAPLPADAEATVRIVAAGQAGQPPQVLGAQTLRQLGTPPIAFRVEYQAEDERLRRGLNIEARVSWGGKVRYYNLNRYVVTLGNAADVHRVNVNPLAP